MNLARGSGVDFCKTLFRHTTGDARELARLGLRTTRDSKPYPLSTPSGELDRCVPEAEISERIWSFVMHVIEARLQSTSWHQHGWPGSFALIMDPQLAMEGCRATAEAWEVFTTAESFACERPGVHHLLQEVYWLRWTINQVTFRGLAHNGWQPTTQVRQHVQRLFGGLGDTKLIEDSHKEIRSQEDEQTNQAINSQRVFHTLTRSVALSARGLPHVELSEDDWQQKQPAQPNWKQHYHSERKQTAKGVALRQCPEAPPCPRVCQQVAHGIKS